jgi:hypothetical protein
MTRFSAAEEDRVLGGGFEALLVGALEEGLGVVVGRLPQGTRQAAQRASGSGGPSCTRGCWRGLRAVPGVPGIFGLTSSLKTVPVMLRWVGWSVGVEGCSRSSGIGPGRTEFDALHDFLKAGFGLGDCLLRSTANFGRNRRFAGGCCRRARRLPGSARWLPAGRAAGRSRRECCRRPARSGRGSHRNWAWPG